MRPRPTSRPTCRAPTSPSRPTPSPARFCLKANVPWACAFCRAARRTSCVRTKRSSSRRGPLARPSCSWSRAWGQRPSCSATASRWCMRSKAWARTCRTTSTMCRPGVRPAAPRPLGCRPRAQSRSPKPLASGRKSERAWSPAPLPNRARFSGPHPRWKRPTCSWCLWSASWTTTAARCTWATAFPATST